MTRPDGEIISGKESDTTLQSILSLIESQLSHDDKTVKIIPLEKLVGVNKTYRCNMNTITKTKVSIEPIVLKFNPNTPVNQPENKMRDLDDFSKRLNNEVASLIYLDSINFQKKIHPELVHHDIMNQLIVTRDMGKNPTLMDLMNDPSFEKPETYLSNYVKLFAELHRHTSNNWLRFKETQKRVNASSPLSDSSVDFREHLTEFEEYLDYLSLEYNLNKKAILFEFSQVEDAVTDKYNPLYGFIHADSGIQNVNANPDTGEMALFDYEFANTGYVLLDIAGLFLGFPQSGKGMRIPERYYYTLMREYFDALSLVSDNLELRLLYALLHWTVGRGISTWMFFIKPNIDDLKSLGTEKLNSTYTSNHECLLFLKNGSFPHLRKLIEVNQSFLAETWENVELKNYFPVFG
jgi:hypothetical protein